MTVKKRKSKTKSKPQDLDKAASKLLTSEYRKNLWTNAQRILKSLERSIPISQAYLLGSFTTKKRRPADVDLIILLQTPKTGRNPTWAVDMVLTTEGKHGDWVLADARKWMKQKYGAKKSAVIKLR